MGSPTPQDNIQKRRKSDQKRLESWKAIANYLHRSVRTVRRWEAREELPVHRHQHTKGSSVFAFCSELDEWRRQRHQSTEPVNAVSDEADTTTRTPTLSRYAAIALVAAFIGGLLGKSLVQTEPATIAQTESGNIRVLLATAVNDGGPTDIGRNLNAALHRDINSLGGRRSISQERIQDVLALMRRDPRSELNPALAREVALRDGLVNALVIPHVEQIGDTLVLSVEIIEPYANTLIAYPSETVSSLESILPVFERLTHGVRAGLQRVPHSTDNPALPAVTTASLPALRLYAQAAELLIDGQATAARELLGLAIIEDSGFASALALQGWAFRRDGAGMDAVLPIVKAAMEYKDRVSLQERYFIEGSYQHFMGDVSRADANYRALLQLQPDHVFGAQALLNLCVESGQQGGCVNEKELMARLCPDDLESNLQAAWALAADPTRKSDTDYFADRARQIASSGHEKYRQESVARVLMFPALSAWAHGDLQVAADASQRIRQELVSLPVNTQQAVIKHLAEFSLALGQVDQAADLLKQLRDPAERYELQASVLFAAGNSEELAGHLNSGKDFTQRRTALLMSMSGLAEEALTLNKQLTADGEDSAHSAVIRASIALSDGRPGTAMEELQSKVSLLTPTDSAFFFAGTDVLSVALKEEGKVNEAISVLRQTAPHRSEAIYHNSGVFWMMCQRHLANLYRDSGREYDAAQIEDQLRDLLILADDDFPIAKSLNGA